MLKLSTSDKNRGLQPASGYPLMMTMMTKPRYVDCGNESSIERKFHVSFALGNASSRERKFVPGSESTWERKFHNSFLRHSPPVKTEDVIIKISDFVVIFCMSFRKSRTCQRTDITEKKRGCGFTRNSLMQRTLLQTDLHPTKFLKPRSILNSNRVPGIQRRVEINNLHLLALFTFSCLHLCKSYLS